ncbi:hypothetical protein BS47DRAFT_1360749 [Hydnum rufescens UP504]|uniref:Uncharacterized protein n=1 Tax=Hydnum rufescens UP504 TaxID=1448309 RepID=A0A9P6B178_9AGAM|nr:hypothetical protein BS47DRAFT_1360749 [Hydnum rufescens UP504]
MHEAKHWLHLICGRSRGRGGRNVGGSFAGFMGLARVKESGQKDRFDSTIGWDEWGNNNYVHCTSMILAFMTKMPNNWPYFVDGSSCFVRGLAKTWGNGFGSEKAGDVASGAGPIIVMHPNPPPPSLKTFRWGELPNCPSPSQLQEVMEVLEAMTQLRDEAHLALGNILAALNTIVENTQLGGT